MAKRKAVSKKTPVRRRMANEPVEIPIIADGCQVIFGDTVGVAVSGEYLALTFYQTIPDPSKMGQGRGMIRRAQAVVQIPIAAGLQLPSIINSHLLELGDASLLTEAQIENVVLQIDKMKQDFLNKAKKK